MKNKNKIGLVGGILGFITLSSFILDWQGWKNPFVPSLESMTFLLIGLLAVCLLTLRLCIAIVPIKQTTQQKE